MGCSPSSSARLVEQRNGEQKNMIIQDFKIRKDPWSLFPGVEYDPWEGSGAGDKSTSSIASKSVRIISPKDSAVDDVSIVDLRSKSDVLKAARSSDNSFKTSQCQTDQPEGVDFDWDLTDNIDNETQTNPSSQSLDVIVQTDQRIVFSNNNRKNVKLKKSDGGQKSSTSSQTSWEVTDREVQVDQTYFGSEQWDPSEKTLTSSLDNSWVKLNTLIFVFKSSLFIKVEKEDDQQNHDRSKTFSKILNFSSQSHPRFTLDESLDEPLAFVHKSSMALSTKRANAKEARYKNKGIQITETSLLYDTDCPPETKVDFLGDDPLFFTEVDDHVQIVSRKWYKSLRKLVNHLTKIVDLVASYQERRDLVTVRAITVWICENIAFDPAYRDTPLDTIDILRLKAGVCREFVKLFEEMCQIAEVEVQRIVGFNKTHHYTPGKSLSVGWVEYKKYSDYKIFQATILPPLPFTVGRPCSWRAPGDSLT